MLPGWRLFPLILPSRLCRPSEFSCGASFAWERLFPPAALDFPPGFFVCVQIFNRSIPCSSLFFPALSCSPLRPLFPLAPLCPAPPCPAFHQYYLALLLSPAANPIHPLPAPFCPALSRPVPPHSLPALTALPAPPPARPLRRRGGLFCRRGENGRATKGGGDGSGQNPQKKVNFISLGQGVWSSFYHFF